ncbi:ParB/RepB/Spo0J family partition protein [Streptomyces wuyuanensis]|uniref:ParB/RepB/Spo0J family partition protein n=1 Tax=Streptomyces wuyuanensis TaxID=1196353 RepID=UPI0034230EFB
MSKASKLGTGASFQNTRPVSSRRQAIDAATKAPTEGAPPPVELPVELISLNPANPRSELGDLTDLAGSLRDHGQKTAISIMSRFAYAEANPDREDELEPGTRYVAIDGNSRLAAAREAGLSTIKVMLDEALGSNPDEILESALVANIHRQELDHLDEARALEQLKKVYGTQEALAARLHRSQGWVSQRLALLKLTPELQEKLVSGEEPAELLRSVGSKKPDEQEAHLQLLKEKKARQDSARATRIGQTVSAGGASNGHVVESDQKEQLTTPQLSSQPDETAEEDYGVMKSPSRASVGTAVQESTAPVPDPRAAPKPLQVKMPWADGVASMDIIFRKVSVLERRRMIGRYIELLGSPDAVVADLEEASDPAYRRQIAEALLRNL